MKFQALLGRHLLFFGCMIIPINVSENFQDKAACVGEIGGDIHKVSPGMDQAVG